MLLIEQGYPLFSDSKNKLNIRRTVWPNKNWFFFPDLTSQVKIIQQGYNGSVPDSFVAAALQSCGFES